MLVTGPGDQVFLPIYDPIFEKTSVLIIFAHLGDKILGGVLGFSTITNPRARSRLSVVRSSVMTFNGYNYNQ